MKKILTLLLAMGSFAVVQAQSREEARRVILGGGNGNNNGSGGNRDVILGGGNNGDSYPTYPGNYPSGSSRQAQIDQVNREYDNKIGSIRNNPYLSNEEKERSIRQLERDRQARIRQLNNYDRNRNYDDDRYERKNNGKHKGWNKKQKNKNWKKG
ncbi:MAG TPA: DUF1542 domain-containing protein, partial [Flavisolibacter sp.]|nr:DUF1542 domain-containing protein [Flavisolibacter sp.]